MNKLVKNLIFVLDNEKKHSDLLQKHLVQKGFEVHTYANSNDLFSHLNRQLPEIIFLDYHISQNEFKKGTDVLISLKEKFPKIEVVMYAGDDNLEVATDTIKHGAYDYIIKGRTSVHKAEIIAENIREKNNHVREMLKYRLATFLLIGALGLFTIITFGLWKAGVFTDYDVHGEDFMK
ncbi:MAG: response regulator [Bacteroidota bacterium]|nr:response regulator [Bacteroidota bacterium]